jgi:4-hydroxy-2-oxoheptanedioate aldolase
MKSNPVKKLLQAGKPTIGCWLSLGDLTAARLLARMGFDWLTVDLEHSPIDWSQAAALFGAVADAGCVPLARVPAGEHFLIKRALDAGAWGIVVPMVDTVEQARRAIAAAKYPPTGNRSLGGTLHALNFSAAAADYYRDANREILVVLQTESPRGVANAEEIYALEGVDAIFIGPVDLRAQMRSPEGVEATDDEFIAMVHRVIEAGKKTGTPTGMHLMDSASVRRWVGAGMRFVALASDLKFMTDMAQQSLSAARGEAVGKTSGTY